MQFINSGSTLLNLALTGDIRNGWPLGRISNIVGDKSSGKTLLAIEAACNFIALPPAGLKPKVYYLESEAAFDKEYAAALGLPVDHVELSRPKTIEDVFESFNIIFEGAKDDEAVLIVLDSLDAVSSRAEQNRDIDDGSYSMDKQKKLGELFRRMVIEIEKHNAHFLIISQIRENIGAMPFQPKYRRSGGRSLDFYATQVVWLSQVAKLTKSSSEFPYGIECEFYVTKNKVSLPLRKVKVPLIFGSGFDDVGSLVKYLAVKSPNKSLDKVVIDKSAGGFLDAFGEKKKRYEELVEEVSNNPDRYVELVTRANSLWDYHSEKSKVSRGNKQDLLKAVSLGKDG